VSPVRVVVTDPTMTMHEALLRRSLAADVEWTFLDITDQAAVCRQLEAGAEIYLGYQFNAAMARAGRKLKFVQVSGTGTDEIDFESLEQGVIVANTFNHERSIAEWVIMAMLALSRQLLQSDRHLRAGLWDSIFYDPTQELYPALRGKTLGLVGFGHIGVEVAKLARPFEMEIMAVTRKPSTRTAAGHGLAFLGRLDDLNLVVKAADYLVLAVPLEDETRGLIGYPQLEAMKSSAFLINVARAGLVDEDALFDALSDRRIKGAALDVWYRYPEARDGTGQTLPANRSFQSLDNVIITPHSSGSTEETYRLRAEDSAQNIRRFLEGKELTNVVWPTAPAARKENASGKGASR
jgi:phosphoglycerate dehydrogenase-like enzyme